MRSTRLYSAAPSLGVQSLLVKVRKSSRYPSQHAQVRQELTELFDVLAESISHVTTTLARYETAPLRVHVQDTRLQILAAVSANDAVDVRTWSEAVLSSDDIMADIFVFTLNKMSGQFSPKTRYRVYPGSRELIFVNDSEQFRRPRAARHRRRVHVGPPLRR
jgi:hypothetical protein